MKRLFILFFLSMALSLLTYAKQVEESTARTVAGNFFASRLGKNQLKVLPTPVLVCTSNDLKTEQDAGTKAAPAFYVFIFTNAPGFVIISGDDIAKPVLAYSMEGSFSTSGIAPGAASWMNWYELQIKDAIVNKLKATSEIQSAWNDLAVKGRLNPSNKSGRVIEPLIKLRWDQSPYYNAKCPVTKNAKKDTAVTGCPATAMAMVMKYHNYPPKGTGTFRYTTDIYGTLSVDFGQTTYEWNKMPEYLDSTSTKAAVNAHVSLWRFGANNLWDRAEFSRCGCRRQRAMCG
jgi:hypothetical protein